MSHLPKKALILYCPYNPTAGSIGHVDGVTLKGCSGQIALQDPDQIVLQLLGVYGADNIESEYKKRFNDMSLAIISDNQASMRVAQQLNFPHHRLDSVKQHIADADVVLVDFTDCKENAWSIINELCQQQRADTIQCIVTDSKPSPTPSDANWWDTIRPRQSYQMRNGSSVETCKDKILIYSYLHEGSGRRDTATTFTKEDIEANGSNGIILAWQFLAEIGHKLGYVPKYGA